MNGRRTDIDLLKTLAIVAVVSYHAGWMGCGYLGVDLFFVVSGFLVVPQAVAQIAANEFHYFSFLGKRVWRLLPLLVVVSLVTLLIGATGMLPDDYENLSETVVASLLFSNNILQYITVRSYWDVVNEFKPLMHTWYIGVLFQFYAVFPLVLLLFRRIIPTVRFRQFAAWVLLACAIGSLTWSLLPSTSSMAAYYLLPGRAFELLAGGIIGLTFQRERLSWKNRDKTICAVSLILLICLCIFGNAYWGKPSTMLDLVTGMAKAQNPLLPQWLLPIIATTLTSIFLSFSAPFCIHEALRMPVNAAAWLGQCSYSLFLWHQPMLAFYRYFSSPHYVWSHDTYRLQTFSLIEAIVFIALLLLIAALSYRYIEQRKFGKKFKSCICAIALCTLIAAAAVYMHAGVVRSVPELGIRKGQTHRNMFSDYNSRVRQYDKDFPTDNGKINVLVVGNSFARDWANVLLESDMADSINLSYCEVYTHKQPERARRCRHVFFFGLKEELPKWITSNLSPDACVWGIGTKSFGSSAGTVYRHRGEPNYLNQTVEINPNYLIINRTMQKQWEPWFVDFINPVRTKDNHVKVFSDEGLLMSQDCRHLTQGGAKAFARRYAIRRMLHATKQEVQEVKRTE